MPLSHTTGLHARTILVLLLTTLPNVPVLAQGTLPSYTFQNLGTLGGSNSYGVGVNNFGEVSGESLLSGNTATHAFLSNANSGMLYDLGTLGGTSSYAAGVNSEGQVVGMSDLAASNDSHAFLSDANGGALQDLGTLGGEFSSGRGINDTGQITGDSFLAPGNVFHAFLSGANGNPLRDLGTLGEDTSSGAGINNAGQVTGYSYLASGSNVHAFLSDANGGPLHDLGTLGGSNSKGSGVNNLGQVVGTADLASPSPNHSYDTHAFLSDANGGTLHDLGTLGGNDSFANGINDAGQVVGFSFLAGNPTGFSGATTDAFLFMNDQMLDLNKLITNSTNGFVLTSAASISNTGFITGSGYNFETGQNEAFLLTPNGLPVPETSSVVSLGLLLSLGMLVVKRSRRKAHNSH